MLCARNLFYGSAWGINCFEHTIKAWLRFLLLTFRDVLISIIIEAFEE